jgi:hypothetical protein
VAISGGVLGVENADEVESQESGNGAVGGVNAAV